MDRCESESRSRISNVLPCELSLGHSTAGHAHLPQILPNAQGRRIPHRRFPHGLQHRHRTADMLNHRLAVRHAALGHPSQQPQHRWAILATPSVSHEPAPASSSTSEHTPATAQPGYFTASATESRHGTIFRPRSCRSRAQQVHRPRPPARRLRRRLGPQQQAWRVARGKDGGCVTGPLARPEAGRVVV
jgi:hypothetical protein